MHSKLNNSFSTFSHFSDDLKFSAKLQISAQNTALVHLNQFFQIKFILFTTTFNLTIKSWPNSPLPPFTQSQNLGTILDSSLSIHSTSPVTNSFIPQTPVGFLLCMYKILSLQKARSLKTSYSMRRHMQPFPVDPFTKIGGGGRTGKHKMQQT